VLEKIASHGLSYADDAMGHHVFQVNVWLSRKRMYGLDQVRSEIETWDVSASDPLLIVAKSCLLDELDPVFDLLPGLVERGPLSGNDVLSWPLFKEARDDPRFSSLKDSILESVAHGEDDEVERFVAAPSGTTYHLEGCRRAGTSVVPASIEVIEARRPAKCCIAGEE
jgi:hypothetical protein